MNKAKTKILFIEGGENPREDISIEVFPNTDNLLFIGVGCTDPGNYAEYQHIVLDKVTALAFLKQLKKAIDILD